MPSRADGWNRNVHYHGRLLAHVPKPCRRALDVGCGLGAFAREVSRVSDHVDAIDLDPRVIHRARELSAAHFNIRFAVADLLTLDAEPYDFISMIAVLHHIEFDGAMAKVVSLL